MDLIYLLHQPDISRTVCSNLSADEIIAVRNVLASSSEDSDFVLNCALPIIVNNKQIGAFRPVNNLTVRAYNTLKSYNFKLSEIFYLQNDYDVLFATLDSLNVPFHEAAFRSVIARGIWRSVEEFLNRGFDVNYQFKPIDPTEPSPLFVAARNGRITILQNLLDRGTNLNQKNNQNENALFSTILDNQFVVAEELINRGIDLTVVNNRGETALMYAQRIGRPLIVKMIQEKLQE